MATNIGTVKIELDRQARNALMASRLEHCMAYNCSNWFEGDCVLKGIYISENGGCGYYKPKADPENTEKTLCK